MFSRILLTICFLILMTFPNIPTFAQEFPRPEKGISRELARWRSANYSDVRYKLNLTLEKMSPTLKGSIEIKVNLTDAETRRRADTLTKNPAQSETNISASSRLPVSASQIILDWRKIRGKEDLSTVANIVLNGQKAEFSEESEHLIINGAKTGENVIKLDFTSPILTSGGAITRYVDKEDNAEYIYSLFVPSDASTAFPCFDQPDLKAKFKLSVYAPSEWKVVSNANALSLNGVFARFIGWEFEETKPISTYVFAFAAGDFAEMSEPPAVAGGLNEARIQAGSEKSTQNPPATAGGSDLTTKIYLRKSQAEKFKQHAVEVFRLNRESIKYLEEYFDYKFPFPKYDFVLIPEFPFGGMEHAGATFLREDRIIFPSEPTANDYITRANLIFHENSHQWFGDTVTMKWFDDLWLKEGFAEFMAYKTLEKVLPQYNAWKTFYERNKQAAYLTDSTQGTTPIYQEIPNLNSAKSAYGNIVYRKAPSFLRQAEFYLGEKEFQTATRSFLKKYEFKNAEWQDLVTEFELATKKDLKDWAKTWVTQRGMPKILSSGSIGASIESRGFLQFNLFGEKNFWKMRFKALMLIRNEVQILNLPQEGTVIEVSGKDSKVVKEIEIGKDEVNIYLGMFGNYPKFVFPNYQDYGYGIFLLGEKSRNYILQNVQNEKDDFLRSMMYGSLWDSVREAELNPKDYVELVIKNIGAEKDEMIVSSLLNRASTALTYYVSAKDVAELAPKLEKIIFEKMQTAEKIGQRVTFFRAFLNLARSEEAKTNLKNLLKSEPPALAGGLKAEKSSTSKISKNLTLKTKDKFDIVAKLLILDDQDAPKLLADLVKTETSDEAKRYAYAANAGIGSAENKLKYWNDFTNNKEISESWIEAAFVNFNTPKHAELTQPFLEKALAELPKLKANRKIFFVNGWLSAFLSGQRDEKSLAIVKQFLTDNPNLDKDLRLKILENADVIERSVKIRGKFAKQN